MGSILDYLKRVLGLKKNSKPEENKLTRRTLVMDEDFIVLLDVVKKKTGRENHGQVIRDAVKVLSLLIEEHEKGNDILTILGRKKVEKIGNILPFKLRKD